MLSHLQGKPLMARNLNLVLFERNQAKFHENTAKNPRW